MPFSRVNATLGVVTIVLNFFLLLAQGFLGSLSQDRYLVYYDRLRGILWLHRYVQDIALNWPHPISDGRLAGAFALRRNLPYVLYGDGRRGFLS